MPIPLNPPIVVPATPEKTYDAWFYAGFQVANLTPAGGDLVFSKVPMVSTTDELLPTQAQGFTVPFWQAVAEIPEAAAAMQAVLAALPKIEAHFNPTKND